MCVTKNLLRFYSLTLSVWIPSLGLHVSLSFKKVDVPSKQSSDTYWWRSPTRQRITVFLQSNTLKLPDLFKLEIGKLIHSHFTHDLPDALSNLFTLSNSVSHKSTRSTNARSKRLYIPPYKTNRPQKCMKYQGSKIWNDISSEIQNSTTKKFKVKFKKHLLQQYL